MLSPNLNINFMGARRIALIFSAVAIVFSLGSLITRGLNFGLDFSGGYLLEMSYSSEVDLADIRSALAEEGFENPLVSILGMSLPTILSGSAIVSVVLGLSLIHI